MLYQIAYLCEQIGSSGAWIWVTGPITDLIEAEAALMYFENKFPAELVDYATGRTPEELQDWLTRKNAGFDEQNTPTRRACLPEAEEKGRAGDRNTPYRFTLPESWIEQDAWLALARKYRAGVLKS